MEVEQVPLSMEQLEQATPQQKARTNGPCCLEILKVIQALEAQKMDLE